MDKLLDIHTHHRPLHPFEAIQNCAPEEFLPLSEGFYSVGIHPWKVKEAGELQWQCLEEALHHPQVLAVGEAGLDRCTDVPLALQQEAFVRQARLAEQVGKPLIIHLVRAADELFRLHKLLHPSQPWIIHGFRGKPQQASQLLRAGFYFSFGERYNIETVRIVPLDRIFLETDEADPKILPEIFHQISLARGISSALLASTLESNQQKVFRLGSM